MTNETNELPHHPMIDPDSIPDEPIDIDEDGNENPTQP